MSEPISRPPARVTLEERKKLTLNGATEVVRFDGDQVELNTCLGPLIVEGSDLLLKCLSLEDGTVVIQGQIRAMVYEEQRHPRGFFR